MKENQDITSNSSRNNEILQYTYLRIDVELEATLGDSFLDSLAVRCIAGSFPTRLTVFNETTYLIRWAARVLLTRAEAVVHLA